MVGALASACLGGPSDNAVGDGHIDLAAAPGAADEATLVGAGSTFVANLVDGWSAQYSRAAPGVSITYQPVGSPAGVQRLRDGDVDFATSDVPLTDLEEVFVGGAGVVSQVPWAAGAVAIVYNLPAVEGLRLSPQVAAAIFSGRVLRWNDNALKADNPDVQLPDLAIAVVHRSDPSATTRLVTSYLKAAAPDVWGLLVGADIDWPRGRGVDGSAAVAEAVAGGQGAIGYTQLSYATASDLGVAQLLNSAGRFVAPTPEAVSAALAAAEVRRFEATFDLYFLSESPGAYPLSTLSYLLYRRNLADAAKSTAMRHFADWALGEGQRSAERLGYVPLPLAIRTLAIAELQNTRP